MMKLFHPFKNLKLYLILMNLLLTSITDSRCQTNIKKYIIENAVPITTIQPDAISYSDLEEIGRSIGNSKIVMLGEQDHGDASTFLAKTRLVKYLHEKKGFNVLAFENNFWGLTCLQDYLDSNKILNPLRFNISWSSCDSFKYMLDYIQLSYEINNPLKIAGLDCIDMLAFTGVDLHKKIDSILINYNISLNSVDIKKALKQLKALTYYDNIVSNSSKEKDKYWINSLIKDTIAYIERNKIFSDLNDSLINRLGGDNLWALIAENLIRDNKYQWLNINHKNNYSYKKRIAILNLRDSAMASNLKWLSKVKYSNDKIIVWAHNYHVSMQVPPRPKYFQTMFSMGNLFTKDSILRSQTFIMGFISRKGFAGRVSSKKYKLPKPKSQSAENWINKSYQYAFVNFRNYNLKVKNKTEEFFMSGSMATSRHEYHKAEWTKIFDGIFFIRKMYPCGVLTPL